MGTHTRQEILLIEQTEKDKEEARLALEVLQGGADQKKEIWELESEEVGAVLNKILMAVIWSYGVVLKLD